MALISARFISLLLTALAGAGRVAARNEAARPPGVAWRQLPTLGAGPNRGDGLRLAASSDGVVGTLDANGAVIDAGACALRSAVRSAGCHP